ncbi:SMI1/KNR4 family protein [Paenibacillus castaneae]|uniref:SMI1/KNR4 family protein n=2 Tax=Paenibacillus castaneae TaxID=474957 RepID=UPI000C9C62E8|nr:SMI1/KNR4 family protein [Paenibacillus castaneae]
MLLNDQKKVRIYMVLTGFWNESDYYTNPISVTEEMALEAERSLGFKLPMAYVELIRVKNGGTPINT